MTVFYDGQPSSTTHPPVCREERIQTSIDTTINTFMTVNGFHGVRKGRGGKGEQNVVTNTPLVFLTSDEMFYKSVINICLHLLSSTS